MARRGENIRKRKDGRWEGRYRALNIDTGKHQSYSVYGKTYAEVKEKLADRKQASKYGNLQKERSVNNSHENALSFSHIAEEWLIQARGELKHPTFIKYRSIYRKYLEHCFQGYLVLELTEEVVVKELRKSFVGDSTPSDSLYKSIYCVLNKIFRYSAENYHTQIIRISYQKHRGGNRPVKILNRTEQAKLVKYLYHDMNADKLGVMICLLTGLRLGEICALRWEDIDLQEKVLHVKRAVQRIEVDDQKSRTILWEGDPKSVFSKREIPISDTLAGLLTLYQKSGKYVLKCDRPMEPRTYQNHFQKYLREAGVEKTNFHVLRHTFATNCIDHGADVKSLSEILGHSDVKITLNRYVHPTLETKRQHMNALASIYGQFVGQEMP